jgi:uncharacterized protein (AIM24 family)
MVLTSLLSGEGIVALQTRVSDKGKVVLKSRGPVEVIDLDDERVAADDRYVPARAERIRYGIRRAALSPTTSVLSGECWLRVYEGAGQVFTSWYPYWRYLLLAGEEMKQEI